MNVVQKFNALDGKKVNKVDLEKLKDEAVNQLQQDVVDRINTLLLNYPSYFFGDKGIIVSVKNKAKWVPTGTALGAAKTNIDYFEEYDKQPKKVKDIIDDYDFEEMDYNDLKKVNVKLKKIGWHFDFGLDAIANNLRPIKGLSAPRHKGVAKEALTECGRLKPGYFFMKGGKIGKSKKPVSSKPKKKDVSGDKPKSKDAISKSTTENKVTLGKGLKVADLYGLELSPNEADSVGLGKAVNPNDIYQNITDKIAEMLDKDIKWEQEWGSDKDGYLLAYNFDSKKPYRGINMTMLGSLYMFDPSLPLLKNPYYLTINQIEKHNGQIKKGTAAHQAIYFTRLYRYQQAEPELEFSTYDRKKMIGWLNGNRGKIELFEGLTAGQIADQSYIPILKYYNVFNGADIEGIDFDLDNFKGRGKITKVLNTSNEKLPIPEAIIDNYPKPSPTIKFGGDSAFFNKKQDLVQMPNIENFQYVQAYYTTFFHELVHSTGTNKRLDRIMGKKFGDKDYAYEELVAELGASFLSAESGILHYTMRNSSAYIKGWRKELLKIVKKDNRFFFRAASKAQQAADFIIQPNKKGEPKYLKSVLSNQKIDTTKPKNVPKPAKSVTSKQKSGTQLGLFGSAQINVDSTYFKNMKVSELRQFALDYFQTFLNGKPVNLKNSIHNIEFVSASGRKVAKGGSMYKEKAAVIERFREIVKYSTYNNWGDRKPNDKKDVLGYLNFKSKLRIDGVKRHVRISMVVYKNRKAFFKNLDVGKKETDSTHKGLDKEPFVGGAKSASKNKNTKKGRNHKKGLGTPIRLDNGITPLPPNPSGVAVGGTPERVLDIPVNEPKEVISDLQSPKKKISANNPLKMDGLITGEELANMHFEVLNLTGKWTNIMQEPAKNLRIAVFGKPKNGKTGASVDLASELTKHGPVLYNFADQGVNKSTQDLWNLFNLNQNKNAALYGGRDLDQLEKYVATGKFKYVFVDLVNAYVDNHNLKAAEFESRFLKKYPEVGFIMVLESTKNGDFKGEQKWMHLPDQIFEVEDFVINSRGRYGTGEVVSWEKGLKDTNPKRYEKLIGQKMDNEEFNEGPLPPKVVVSA